MKRNLVPQDQFQGTIKLNPKAFRNRKQRALFKIRWKNTMRQHTRSIIINSQIEWTDLIQLEK